MITIPVAVDLADAISVDISEAIIDVKISEDPDIDMDLGTFISLEYASDYDGAYVVTPRAHSEVVLETMGKTLGDDITVQEVPYYETSNTNGTTVYIASEV